MDSEHLIVFDAEFEEFDAVGWSKLSILFGSLSFEECKNILSETFFESGIHFLVFLIFFEAEDVIDKLDGGI